MISGAARAEAAVLVIDAKEGVRENSRRHGYILSMLGIRQVVVCVNKMDLVGYARRTSTKIEKEYRAFLERHRRGQPAAVHPGRAPIAGDEPGDARARRRPGTRARRCWRLLDALPKAPPKIDQPLRMPVQAVYKFTEPRRRPPHLRRAASRPARSRSATRWSSRRPTRSSTIKSIEGFNAPPRDRDRGRLVDRASRSPRKST